MKVSSNDFEGPESSSSRACRRLEYVSTDHSYTPKNLQTTSEKFSDLPDESLLDKIKKPALDR